MQKQSESCLSFFRTLIKTYFLTKGMDIPASPAEVRDEDRRYEIVYLFLRGLRDANVANQVRLQSWGGQKVVELVVGLVVVVGGLATHNHAGKMAKRQKIDKETLSVEKIVSKINASEGKWTELKYPSVVALSKQFDHPGFLEFVVDEESTGFIKCARPKCTHKRPVPVSLAA